MPDDDDIFDFDDLDVGFDAEAECDDDDEPESPDYRATVVDGRVTVIPWNPSLITCGPMTALLWERERAGVTIVDLTKVSDAVGVDLLARVLAGGGGRRAERALERWAGVAGYRRLWLPSRIVDLSCARDGVVAATTCTSCRVEYRESGPEFWAHVRLVGMFPGMCPLCGGDLPQWSVGRSCQNRASQRDCASRKELS